MQQIFFCLIFILEIQVIYEIIKNLSFHISRIFTQSKEDPLVKEELLNWLSILQQSMDVDRRLFHRQEGYFSDIEFFISEKKNVFQISQNGS